MSNSHNKHNTHDIMCYLSNKLTSKAKDVALLLTHLSSRLPNDSTIINNLQEIDVLFKQASCAIKALVAENNSLKMQVYNLQKAKTINVTSLRDNCNMLIQNNKSNSYHNNKDTIEEYAGEIMKRIVKCPNVIIRLKQELGEDFMMKIMKRNVNTDYLDKVNDILSEVEEKKSNVKFNTQDNYYMPLRIKMTSKDKNLNSINQSKGMDSCLIENEYGGSILNTNYDSPRDKKNKRKNCNNSKSRKSNSKMKTVYRTFEESLRKYSD